MTFEEFKQHKCHITLKHIHLRDEELNRLCREYEKDLPFKRGDIIKFFTPVAERHGVIEDIHVGTVPIPYVGVKLKGRKPYYDVQPELVEIIERADSQPKPQPTAKRKKTKNQ